MSYKDTVFLPVTTLPIKAKPEGELPILAGWDNLYTDLRDRRQGNRQWLLHDGPPYANGDIHIGHALNKVLKDITVRGYNNIMGFDAPYVPGWDCHGLPIEWKVEEEWRKAKKDKNADPKGFRDDCRAFAQKWVDTQKSQFQRLGIMADWNNPFGIYKTMSPEWESGILHAFHQMVEKGVVYRANKPVLWSPAERTALAEAEVTDSEHMVPNIWVKFKINAGPLHDDKASLLVWTTTPWSLPGNVAVAYNPNISYGLYETETGRFVVADALASQALREDYTRLRDVPASDFNCSSGYSTPLGEALVQEGCIVPADFVREETGTGFVHVGPAHSTEDWNAWRAYAGADAVFPNPIMENGVYADDVPVFAGVAVTKGKKLGPANEVVIEHLIKEGTLYHREDRPLTMQHSWRSNAVLITRAAPQVFIDLTEAREKALNSLESVQFNPPHSRQRMVSMLQNRPDWLVSRQRLWGTPLALFVHKMTGEICADPEVLSVTHQTLMDAGSEKWFDLTVEDIFKYTKRTDHTEWERLNDVLDVWFDSGCVHYMMNSQADLVIEGSDQSRGWFQTSLLVASLLGKEAPYKSVLTHGFTLDANGRKMSKSEGNVLDPLAVIDQFGADTIRVWVASIDATDDMRISLDAMKGFAETTRKIRNTLRYMVGALHGFEKAGELMPEQMPELERYILHRTNEIHHELRKMMIEKSYSQYMAIISNFCVHELSTLWFDIRKDALYCDGDTLRRKAYLHTLDTVLRHMLRWIAPVMVFTAEEINTAAYGGESIHLQTWPMTMPWRNDAISEKWERLLDFRSTVLAKIEEARSAGLVKASTEVELQVVMVEGSQLHRDIGDMDIAEFTIVGMAQTFLGNEESVSVTKMDSDKCDRCWLTKADVHECSTGHLCDRCCELV